MRSRLPRVSASLVARLVGVAALLALAGAGTARAQDTRTIRFESSDIAVFNYVGTLRVSGSTSGSAEAVVALRGDNRDQLEITRGDVRGRESLRVRYPDGLIRSPDRARGRTMTWVRDDGTWGDGDGRRGRRVEISNDSRALDASADIELRVPRGTTARVYLLAGRVDVRNVEGELHVDVAAASISALGTRGALWLDTGSGEVDVSDAQGDLSLDIGSGNVTVRNARGGRLNADTGSGDVTLDGITFETGNFDTGSGNVRVTNAEVQRSVFDTGSGDVLGSFRTSPASISMDSGSGDVTVELPKDAGLQVNLSTSSGDISTDFPIQVTRQSRRSLRGTIGDGRGRLDVESGSGDLRLRIRP